MNRGDAGLTNVVVRSVVAGTEKVLLGPITLARGETKAFYGSVAQGTDLAGLVVNATGASACKGTVVSSSDNCLGNLVVAAPVLAPVQVAGETAEITWSAIKGVTYRVQSAATSSAVEWQDEVGDVVASGDSASKTLPATDTERYYRVIAVRY
jgi:hypothetical protein